MTLADPSTVSRDVAGHLPRPTKVRYLVLALLSAVAMMAYALRYSMAVANAPIAQEFSLDTDAMGWLMSSFYIGYSVLQVPSGWLADRWGPRKVLTACVVAWSVAGALMALAPGYAILLPLWFLAGIAQAGAFPCATNVIRHWLPSTRCALATGILGSSMSLGAAISTPLTRELLDWTTWRWTFAILSLPGIAWAALFYFWYRDRPSRHGWVNRAELKMIEDGQPDHVVKQAATREETCVPAPANRQVSAAPTPWLGLLTSRAMWAIGAQQFFRAAAEIFFATWFITFLTKTRGITIKNAALLNIPPLVAMVLAGPLGGAISDWLLKRTGSRRVARQYFAVVNLLFCALLVTAAYFAENTAPAVMFITAGSFFGSLGGVSAYAITIDMGGEYVGTVFSLMNMCGNIGAAVCPVFVAWLVLRVGNWEPVLFLFAGVYVAAAVSWLLLNPNGTVLDNAVLDNTALDKVV